MRNYAEGRSLSRRLQDAVGADVDAIGGRKQDLARCQRMIHIGFDLHHRGDVAEMHSPDAVARTSQQQAGRPQARQLVGFDLHESVGGCASRYHFDALRSDVDFAADATGGKAQITVQPERLRGRHSEPAGVGWQARHRDARLLGRTAEESGAECIRVLGLSAHDRAGRHQESRPP